MLTWQSLILKLEFEGVNNIKTTIAHFKYFIKTLVAYFFWDESINNSMI